MAAAQGAGIADIRQLANDWVRTQTIYHPDPALKALYDELGEKWAQAYAAQLQLAAEGITTSMWKAPGL